MLNFDQLRETNVSRCEESFHPLDEWSVTDWACALTGEAGEAANVAKKIRRLFSTKGVIEASRGKTFDPAELHKMLADELADVVIYADLLAARMGINLGNAVAEKFNLVSEEIGSPRRL